MTAAQNEDRDDVKEEERKREKEIDIREKREKGKQGIRMKV